jgi:hypothetical protein
MPLWWATSVIATILAGISVRLSLLEDVDMLIVSSAVSAAGDLVYLLYFLLTASVVRSINGFQEALKR